jgi:hypothetical protein
LTSRVPKHARQCARVSPPVVTDLNFAEQLASTLS